MKHVGRNHPILVQPMVVDLLGYHPFLDTSEPLIDDAYCKWVYRYLFLFFEFLRLFFFWKIFQSWYWF